MGEGAVAALLIYAEVPYNSGKQDNRRLDEKITLFLYPCLVQIQEDCVCRLVCVADVRHKPWVDRIASVRATRVIEIYHIELRLYLVLVEIFQQLVIGDN